MAFIKKSGGKWRVQIERKGVRASGSFDTKAEASAWAAKEEAAILSMSRGMYPNKTLGDAFDRYMDDVSAGKEGGRWERLRLTAFKREFPDLAAMVLHKVDSSHMAGWRDQRLKGSKTQKKVTGGTVQRDINLLSNVFTKARDEWKWMGESPLKGVKRPKDNPPRTRRITDAEAALICDQCSYTGTVTTKLQEVAFAFLVALETGMRAGEILSLNPSRVDFKARVARVPHKMQHLTLKEREIPLTKEAVELLKKVKDRDPFFTISSASLDAMFRKVRDRQTGMDDLHFHDARAEALTRLSRKVDVLTLARISGHKDIALLARVYYRETAEEIARRL